MTTERSGPFSSHDSHANVRYLNTPQRSLRFRQLKSRATAAERKLKKLVADRLESDGVCLEDDMQDDFGEILNEMTDEIRCSNPEDSLKRIFWDHQLEALQGKNPRQMRWHHAVIQMCLHLKFKSSSAYRSLRESGVITLPCERTLFDYSHWSKRTSGFSEILNKQWQKEADIIDEKDKYVVLTFDEMKVKDNLVFDKHSLSKTHWVYGLARHQHCSRKFREAMFTK